MNTRKILTAAITGIVEGYKYYAKLSECKMDANFIDDITDPYMDIVYNLEPLDGDWWDAITDTAYDLATKEEAIYRQDIGIDEENWISITVRSVEELVNLVMAEFFPHIKEEK